MFATLSFFQSVGSVIRERTSVLRKLSTFAVTGGWPGFEKFLFVGMRIVERISLRHVSGKYRVAEGAQVRCLNLGLGVDVSSVGLDMPAGLKRYYGKGHWHFITFSCYRRLPLLKTVSARDIFARELGKVRDETGFQLLGYVVMPEHVHLLMSEPPHGTPSTVLQKLKLRVARKLRKRRGPVSAGQMRCLLRRRGNRCERFGRRGFTISMCTAKERRGRS